MASGTITGTTSNEYIDCKVEWSSTADKDDNSSALTATLYYRRNNTGFTTYGTGSFYITVGVGTAHEEKTVTIGTSWVAVLTWTTKVDHNSNGSKSVTISAKGSIDGTTLTSTTLSGTAKLDTIPRASSITSASNVTLGNYCKVVWTPLSKDFVYSLVFSIGDWSKEITKIAPKTTNSYTYTSFFIPLTGVANEITDSNTGTMTVELKTYSNTITLIGSDTDSFKVTVPESSDTKPSVSMSLTPNHSLESAFDGLYIKTKSKVQATINGTAKYDAKIKSKSMKVQGVTDTTSPYVSGYLSIAGSIKVYGYATDSRGITGSIEKSITVIDYASPEVLPPSGEASITCARCDSSGNLDSSGTHLRIKARRRYSKVESDGDQKNFCVLQYRYRKDTTNTFSAWKALIAKSSTSTDTVNVILDDVVTSTTSTYIVQIGVADDIGESDAIQIAVPSDEVSLHIRQGGTRIGLLGYAKDTDEPGIDAHAPIHGGAVDNLTLGTLLTATATAPIDLNDIKEPGCYYSYGADNSQYITHSPYTDGGFSLTVRELQSVNMIRQELFYGRTSWQRHYNGSTKEWSDWLRFLMTEYPETTSADFVSDIGVYQVDANSYWRYRKWKSGAVDLNGVFQVTPVQESTTGTAAVRYSEQIQIPLPFKVENFQFTGTPASNYFLLTNAAVTTDSDGNHKIAFRLLRFTDFDGLSLYVRIMASGKYT